MAKTLIFKGLVVGLITTASLVSQADAIGTYAANGAAKTADSGSHSCIVSGSTERTPSYSSAVSAAVDGNTVLAANGGVWFAASADPINFLTLGFRLVFR